jgi:S-DNA-T family DNA segregation ATPase FtsK/SpoIIIE
VSVRDQPISVLLRSYSHVTFSGDADAARDCVRALLAELATFHAPDELRVAVCAAPSQFAHWDWIKWLPHAAHPSRRDAAGPGRLCAESVGELRALFGPVLADRAGFEEGATVTSDEPYLVLVLDGAATVEDGRWDAAGFRNAVIVDVAAASRPAAARHALALRITADRLESVEIGPDRAEHITPLGRPDRLSAARAVVLARLLAPIRLAGTGEPSRPLESDFGLAAMLGIRDLDAFDVEAFWRAHAQKGALRVAVGVGQDGSPVHLDIKEPALGGMGPHGMLVGATGSGKSELLRTLVLALALTHSPEMLNFVLVDFKGGATFLGLDRLFHTSAVITNLADEVHLVARMQDALHGELVRRQELLRAAGNFVSIHDYERARAGGAALEPLPTLFVVVDEFSELISAHREFMDLFIVIGRLGRSLGVHLLLASQRLDQGRISQLETHLSYRIGLRTFSAAESRAVLGVPDAYHLPSAPGNGFLAHGTEPLTRFKAAYVSGHYQKRRAAVATPGGRPAVSAGVVPYTARPQPLPQALEPRPAPEPPDGPGGGSGPEPDPAAQQAGPTMMDVIVERLSGIGPPAHRVWLPPLGEPPTLDHLLPPLAPDPELGLRPLERSGAGTLRVPLGIVDRPFEQRREELAADLAGAGGHVGVAGGPQSGKSSLLRTLMCTLALTHSPAQVQFYALDFGGGTLGALSGLPHTGGVAGRHEGERVGRTMAHLLGLLDERERRFASEGVDSMATYRRMRGRGETGAAGDPYGDVFLIVDGWSTLRQDYDDLIPALRTFAARGLNYGLHLVVSTTRWSELPAAIRDQLGTRFELRLGDAVESVVDARAAQSVPRDRPGRGLTAERLHFLTALPRIDGLPTGHDLAEGIAALVEAVSRSWPGEPAPPVRTLPRVLDAGLLPPAETAGAHGDLRVPLAWDEQRLDPVWHDFAEHAHLAVVGDAESGRTNLLRLLASAITRVHRPDEAQLVVIDPRRRLGDEIPEPYRLRYAVTESTARQAVGDLAQVVKMRVPGAEVAAEALRRRDWWTGPRVYLLADDYDMVASNFSGVFDPLLELIPYGADIGLHLAVARAAAGASRPDALLRRLTELNSPALLLSAPPAEGAVLGVKARILPPGRGVMISRRGALVVQTALLPERAGAGAVSG